MGQAECSILECSDGARKLCSAKPTMDDRCDGKIDGLKCAVRFMPDGSCNSLHLNTLVQEYLELSCSPQCRAPGFNIDDGISHEKRCLHELQAVVDGMAHDRHAGLRKEVLRACRKARAACSKFTRPFVSKHEQLQSSVLKHLRDMGFDAGICTSKRSEPAVARDLSSQFYPEEYAYMDLVMAQTAAGKDEGLQTCEGERVLIDLRFRSGFEIARPSPAYVDLLRVVPAHYVGTAGILHKIIKLLSDAMKRSLAGQGMPLPPWRTLAFLKSKWLSPHRRLGLPCSPEQDEDSTSSASSNRSSKASAEFLLRLPAAIANKPVLTDRNAMPPSALRAPKSCAAHRPSAEEKLTTSTPSWLLPPLSQHCNFSKKPRKLVGALTLELQHASLAGSAKSTPIASLRFRI